MNKKVKENVKGKSKKNDDEEGKGIKSRFFCFTLYHVDEEESEKLNTLYENGFLKTLIYTHELGSDGKNPHIQGYMVTTNPNRWMNVKKKLNGLFDFDPNAHIEIARGSGCENFNYITKELKKNPNLKHVMLGEKPLPPGRKRDDSKFESYVELLEKGDITLKEIEKEDLAHYVRHEAHYLSVRSKLLKMAIKPPKFVAWFAGSTGTGKTYTAKKLGEELEMDVYDMDCHNNFFNNYNSEEMAIWDDYRNGPITFNALLKITDRSGCDINIKGSKVFFCPRIMIFTSPDGIESAKTNEMKDSLGLDNRFDQLKRRVYYNVNFVPERKGLPSFEDVERVSSEVRIEFKRVYKQFLIETGFGEFVDKIKGLSEVEPLKLKKIMEYEKITINKVSNV